MAKIYAKPIPPVERMQEVSPVENLQKLKTLVRDPKESPTDMIKAAQLMKRSKTPVAYLPRSLAQAATQAQLPVAPTSSSVPQARAVPQPRVAPQPRVDPRYAPQPRVPTVVPPPISPEDEAILMAQAGGRASIPQQVQNLSSRGRHGDTMLMHVNPEEFQGLSTLLGPTTTNPDTGLPEAFAWWLPLIGAAIGGIATKSWKGAALGGLAGLGGAFALPGMAGGAAGATVAPTLGSAGASTLAPAVGTATLSGAAAPMGFYATPMAAAGAGAVQSAIPGLAAGTFSSVPGGGSVLNPAVHNVLSSEKLLAQGGARNVPTNWVTRNVGQPIRNFLNYSGKPTGSISPDKLVNTKGQSLLHRTSDVTSGVQGSGIDSLWKKGLGWAKDHPLETASGLYGISSLLNQPQYSTSTPTLRKPATIDLADVDPKSIRKERTLTEEEINKIMAGEIPPPQYLDDTGEFADISFATAKQGGIVSLYTGGGAETPGGPRGPALPGSYEYRQQTGTWFPDNYHPYQNPYGHLKEKDQGGGGPPPPSPFEFPEVSPFASGASNFNAQDVLSRIAGPSISNIGNTIPTNIPTPPSPLDPATLGAGQGALADLLSRASQSSFADVGGIREVLEQQRPTEILPQNVIQNQAGGPVQFATGGEFAGHLQGVGDGMSDQIPFRVVPQTPQDVPNAPDMAVLSTDEYVFPADAVSMLGNGSSDAGAKILDSAVKNVRRASIGTPKQIKQINGQQVLQGALTT
jgi:hypothetical protein